MHGGVNVPDSLRYGVALAGEGVRLDALCLKTGKMPGASHSVIAGAVKQDIACHLVSK